MLRETSSPYRGFHILAGITALAVGLAFSAVLFRVDLSPRVESDFFFSTDDPQLQASQRLAELFPSSPQILLSATGPDRLAPEYLANLRELGDALAALPGVQRVQSLAHGPSRPEAVAESPLWSRLLLGSEPNTSLVIAFLEPEAGPELVPAVESLVAEQHAPSFALQISGVPYVVEQIRRHLEHDLRLFSATALAVFGLLIALLYRSWPVVLGTLLTCTGACAITLTGLHALGKPIGLLTANIATIVFVLTLSHIVFLTASWQRAAAEPDPRRHALRATFPASAGCMVTTFLGFGSLLLASAKPLRELGIAGSLGTVTALALAYGLYPMFLRDSARSRPGPAPTPPFPLPITSRVALPLVALALLAGTGIPRIDTDPGLLSFFGPESPIRPGLERIDRNGGSSPLLIAVQDDDERLDAAAPLLKMAALQAALDEDPAVGMALSLPVLLDEARRVPLAGLLPASRLIEILDSARYDHVARTFITPDRKRGLFFLRMREGDRAEPRSAVVARIRQTAADLGLGVEAIGGLYDLQSQLASLVAGSLLQGISALLLLFLPITWVVGRSLGSTAAMGLALLLVPVTLLGTFGHLGWPIDIISSPAVNVALALGIDSMIHLTLAARRLRGSETSSAGDWAAALHQLWRPVTGAMLVLAAGFGIFSLSSFPPTQRFGGAVALGTLAATVSALLVLPWLAQGWRRRGNEE